MTLRRLLRALVGVRFRRLPLRVLAKVIRFSQAVFTIVRHFVKPQPKHALFLAPILLIGLMKMRGGEPIPLEPAQAIQANALTIDAPDEVAVGTPYAVTVSGLGAGSTSTAEVVGDEAGVDRDQGASEPVDVPEVTLLVDSGYLLRQFTAPVEGDTVTFDIPPIDGPSVGVTTLAAIEGDRTGHANVNLIAGPAVDPLELFLGPRTIEATGDTATMAVVIALDELGNPVPDGTPVTYLVTRPDFRSESGVVPTQGLISWTRIGSGTLAGKSKLAVEADGAGGKELDFLEVSGTPLEFEIFLIDPPVPADGRSLIRVRTGPILDSFGNAIPDGIDVFADMSGDDGARRLKSETIKGIAEFTIEAPSRPGETTIVVQASGVQSESLTLDFAPMVTDVSVNVVTDLDGMAISVGPVFSTLGAYVPDGSPVLVQSEFGPSEHPLFNGEVTITLPLTTEPVELEVLGFTRTIQVDE